MGKGYGWEKTSHAGGERLLMIFFELWMERDSEGEVEKERRAFQTKQLTLAFAGVASNSLTRREVKKTNKKGRKGG